MPISNRRKVDTNIEKRIVTGMIVSKEYMQEVFLLIDLAYFQNTYTKIVADWCLDHYSYYEETPFNTIQDIFNLERPKLREEEAELIAMLLSDVNEKYKQEEGINAPYLIDRTVEFCKSRELEITAGNIKVLLERGDLKGAEDQISGFRKIQKLTSDWVNPFDPDEISKTFAGDAEFFRFPGVLGDFFGNLERGWLVGLSGAFKAGKTWFSSEFEIIGVLSGLRVASFSLEMTVKQKKHRIYKRFTAAGDEAGDQLYPVMDCQKNQRGSCGLEIRTQNATLVDAHGNIPDWDENNPYRVCAVCRGKKNNEYRASTWFEMLQRPEYSPFEVDRAMGAWRDQIGHLYRIKSYPRFSANIGDIRRDLDLLELVEGFVPDIIVVDYADILKPEDRSMSGVEKEDRSWIALAQMAAERHALVIAPTQVTKDAMDAQSISGKHMARWVGKLGHVDIMATLNQTEAEKLLGRARIGIIAHRHADFTPSANVTILQKLKLGQPNLDSEFIIEGEEEEDEAQDG